MQWQACQSQSKKNSGSTQLGTGSNPFSVGHNVGKKWNQDLLKLVLLLQENAPKLYFSHLSPLKIGIGSLKMDNTTYCIEQFRSTVMLSEYILEEQFRQNFHRQDTAAALEENSSY